MKSPRGSAGTAGLIPAKHCRLQPAERPSARPQSCFKADRGDSSSTQPGFGLSTQGYCSNMADCQLTEEAPEETW